MNLPETCVNIWCVIDQNTDFVYRLFARAYALDGEDSDKSRILKSLALSDYHLAPELPVLKKYTSNVLGPSGTKMEVPGLPARTIKEILPDILDQVCSLLQKDFPTKAVADPYNPRGYKMKFSDQPYYVLTYLSEDASGGLEVAGV